MPLGWAKEAPILTQSRIDVPRSGDSTSTGQQPIAGVAWAPDRGVSKVEVQVDEGAWAAAELSTPDLGRDLGAVALSTGMQPAGDHTLRVRATDGTGEVQTATVTEPAPDGARGYHTINVRVG